MEVFKGGLYGRSLKEGLYGRSLREVRKVRKYFIIFSLKRCDRSGKKLDV